MLHLQKCSQIATLLLISLVGCSNHHATNQAVSVNMTLAKVSSVETQNRPELKFLADSIEDVEKRLNHIQIRYDFQAGPTQRYSWAVCNGMISFNQESIPASLTTSKYLWDGHYHWSTIANMVNGSPVFDGAQRTIVSSVGAPAEQYLYFTLQRIGSNLLSEAIRKYGVSAEKRGEEWIVRLKSFHANNPGGFDTLTLAIKRSYHVSKIVSCDSADNILAKAEITDWIQLEQKDWLPKSSSWWRSKSPKNTMHLDVKEVREGNHVPTILFTWTDDPSMTLYDADSKHFLQKQKRHIVPITQQRMLHTLDIVRKANDVHTSVETTTILDDNGARPEGMCGLQCIWIVGMMKGKAMNWDDLISHYPSIDQTHSLADLRRAAQDHSFSLTGLHVPFDKLRQVPTPFVVLSQIDGRTHYFVVTQINPEDLVIFFPPSFVDRVPFERFDHKYWGNGYVLASAVASN